MNEKSAIILGSTIGLSVAIGAILSKNKDLQREASDQLRTVLGTTRKLVGYYSSAVTAKVGDSGGPAEDSPDWDQVLENISQR